MLNTMNRKMREKDMIMPLIPRSIIRGTVTMLLGLTFKSSFVRIVSNTIDNMFEGRAIASVCVLMLTIGVLASRGTVEPIPLNRYKSSISVREANVIIVRLP